jgi:choline dehydrogenase-like flavoprotein
MHIGKPIGSMSFDRLDPAAPEFDRFSVQQIYFPTVTNFLAQPPGGQQWFGSEKRAMSARWRSWLTLLTMTEDGNEGEFGAPPPTGSHTRIASSLALGTLRYRPGPATRHGWELADREVAEILERDGLARVLPWSDVAGAVSAHPLASCRMGEDPSTSALDDHQELRGHPGLFVTDGAAVPTSLCVNPSLTIAALAERASAAVVARAAESGVQVVYGAPAPGGETEGRRMTLPLARTLGA